MLLVLARERAMRMLSATWSVQLSVTEKKVSYIYFSISVTSTEQWWLMNFTSGIVMFQKRST